MEGFSQQIDLWCDSSSYEMCTSACIDGAICCLLPCTMLFYDWSANILALMLFIVFFFSFISWSIDSFCRDSHIWLLPLIKAKSTWKWKEMISIFFFSRISVVLNVLAPLCSALIRQKSRTTTSTFYEPLSYTYYDAIY